MVLTKEEEDITKAEVALKIAKDKLHKHNVVVSEEIKTAHDPLTATILATHKVTTDELQKDVNDATIALKELL